MITYHFVNPNSEKETELLIRSFLLEKLHTIHTKNQQQEVTEENHEDSSILSCIYGS